MRRIPTQRTNNLNSMTSNKHSHLQTTAAASPSRRLKILHNSSTTHSTYNAFFSTFLRWFQTSLPQRESSGLDRGYTRCQDAADPGRDGGNGRVWVIVCLRTGGEVTTWLQWFRIGAQKFCKNEANFCRLKVVAKERKARSLAEHGSKWDDVG